MKLLDYCFIAALFLINFTVPTMTANKLLVVGFDGFRYDYHMYYSTPNLNLMAKAGVHANRGMRASFTTKTYPNFYTIATGLYEESQGIVDNNFYDSKIKQWFSITDEKVASDLKWWLGEPIWVTAKKQGKKTGVYSWPGIEVKRKGNSSDFLKKYDARVDYKSSIDTVIEWLTKGKCDLAMVYYREPENTAHKMGAFHVKVKKVVEEMDSLIGYLLNKMKSKKLTETTNLLVLSDHGMTSLKWPNKRSVIALNNYLSLTDDVQNITMSGAIAGIIPKAGKAKAVYGKLKNKHPYMQVYMKTDLPDRFHYKNSVRIPEIILIPAEGYIIQKFDSFSLKTHIGQHGYDNDRPSMRAIFYGQGPNFKPNSVLPLFDNVNIYALMCQLLKIKPAANNGTITPFTKVLK